MTGFGQVIHSSAEMEVSVEIRTVNSRYLDLHFHLARELSWLEPKLRKAVQSRLKRGRVNLSVEVSSKALDRIDVSEPVVKNYLAIAERLKALGVAGDLELASLLRLPGVTVQRQDEQALKGLEEAVLESADECLEKVQGSRLREGTALESDLSQRAGKLADLTGRIERDADKVEGYYREKLGRKLEDLKPKIDEARFAQEILYYVERADIMEEITRLKTHIEQFQDTMKQAEESAVGRQLDFIAQEMGREMNTILSKAPLPGLSDLAVEGKTEIERIREQVQNVE